jgi:hypothetical protein
MDTRGIATKFARVSVYPSDGCAALARDFGERDGWGKRVIYRTTQVPAWVRCSAMKQESALSSKRQ